MEISKVKDKIQKLLALSSSSNVHEAARAAEAAQRLMNQYNIQAESLKDNEEEIKFEFGREVIPDRDKTVPLWRRNLLHAVALANGCRMSYMTIERDVSLIIYGTESDRAATKYIFSSLINVIRGFERIFQLTANERVGKQETTAFKMGAVAAISNSLQKSKPQTKEEGIVLWNRKSSELDEWMPKLGKAKAQTITDADSYSIGYAEGSRIDVSGRTRGALGKGMTGLNS